MKLAVIGTGYVGLVTGACLSEVGHFVTCVDKDLKKVASLTQGVVEIYEPGLDVIVKNNLQSGRLCFTDELASVLDSVEAVFIAVGTPPNEDGSTDLVHVVSVANGIAESLNKKTVIIVKSTVPVGTCCKVEKIINDGLAERGLDFRVDVVSNPEFLKEGAAVNDFTRPDRIIVGSENKETIHVMREIYAPYNRKQDRIMVMDVVSSELTKYAANAMLATKISFINEVANIAEFTGADIDQVRMGIGSDPRIGYEFIYAGCGYGGSCFPKDVKSMINVAHQAGYDSQLLQSVEQVNEGQKKVLFQHISQHFSQQLKGKIFALWGLAFKPETNDIREAPSRVLMELLWGHGAMVQAYDPAAMKEIQEYYGERDDLILVASKEDAVESADALIICTEWKTFKIPDHSMLKKALKQPVIFDGRNLYDPEKMKKEGFTYYGIGRGESCNLDKGSSVVVDFVAA